MVKFKMQDTRIEVHDSRFIIDGLTIRQTDEVILFTVRLKQVQQNCKVDKRQWSGTDTIEFHILP